MEGVLSEGSLSEGSFVRALWPRASTFSTTYYTCITLYHCTRHTAYV